MKPPVILTGMMVHQGDLLHDPVHHHVKVVSVRRVPHPMIGHGDHHHILPHRRTGGQHPAVNTSHRLHRARID